MSGARVAERIPWTRLGSGQPASALLYDAVRGGLWLGFKDGGFAHFRDGQLRAMYAGAEGEVRGFYFDRNGTLWAPTVGGLSRIKDGHILTLTSQNGLPCNRVHWMIEDDAGSVWLHMACGVVRISRSELDAWASQSKLTIHVTVFDRSDGVTSHRLSAGYDAVVAKSSDGKLWFVRNVGLSVIDPHHLAFNKLPPPVHIEQITADGKTYWRNLSGEAPLSLELPPLARDVTIAFTALSLVAPEKVHFRFKLEGQDSDWREVANDRQVQYSNLAPRNYTFRVKAANNSGVWNEDGAVLHFSIAPAYYQTRWFEALVVAGAFALVWAGYRVRVRQVARDYQRRLDERVNERTRIARELHDTLLQSFHGLLLRFQTALYCCQIARQTRKSNSLVRSITRRRRSPKGAMPCRDCGPPPSKRTTSLWRSARLEKNSRPTAAASDRHSMWPSKARRASSTRLFVTRSTRLRRKPFAMPSGMRRPDGSRSTFVTTTTNSDCACAMMVRGSIRRCSPPRSRGTLRPARHAGTRRADWRETGGVERSGRWDGGGAAPSGQHRLRDIPEAHMAPTGEDFDMSGTPPASRPTSVVVALCTALLLLCRPVFALNASVDVAQYKHTSWKVRDGFVGGFIQAFAQTRPRLPGGWAPPTACTASMASERFGGIRPRPPRSGTSAASWRLSPRATARSGLRHLGAPDPEGRQLRTR